MTSIIEGSFSTKITFRWLL